MQRRKQALLLIVMLMLFPTIVLLPADSARANIAIAMAEMTKR